MINIIKKEIDVEESFNKEYNLTNSLKKKQKGRNRDYHITEMDNYMEMKEQLEKNQENLEKANKKSLELDNKSKEVKEIISDLKPTLIKKDNYILKQEDKDKIENIVGQEHLVGPNGVITKMLMKNYVPSIILYGNPGIGKTTIALTICKTLNVKYFTFNASTDNKAQLKSIIDEASEEKYALLIVDEIHRMKKDIQDYLLPFVENGTINIIGITTVNPYHSVNPAIRSRCHIYRLNPLEENDLKKIMREEENILRKVGTQNPFTVPEGYFDNLTSEIMAFIPEETPAKVVKMPTLWDRIKPWTYMAAMFAGAALLIRLGSSSNNEATITNQLAADESELEMKYISTIVDGAMMDDYSLYVYLSDLNMEEE